MKVMAKVITDGTTKVGVFKVPERKKPALCIEVGNKRDVYGYFSNEKAANEFMDRLVKMVGAKAVK